MLPLSATKKTAVLGPFATAQQQLLGSYFDIACPGALPGESGPVAVWDCIETPLAAVANITGRENVLTSTRQSGTAGAVATAKLADQVILFLGETDEGEGHDRKNTTIDEAQEAMALGVIATGKPTVVVLLHGGILSVDRLAGPEKPNALVNAWFPGIKGAEAMAKSLFGVPGWNRWGKMTATMYSSSFSSLVPMLDMSFTSGLGRTYRYWRGPAPLFEFGHGLCERVCPRCLFLRWCPPGRFLTSHVTRAVCSSDDIFARMEESCITPGDSDFQPD